MSHMNHHESTDPREQVLHRDLTVESMVDEASNFLYLSLRLNSLEEGKFF